MSGGRPSRASRREVKREFRRRRRAARLALVPPIDPKRRPGRIAIPLVLTLAFVVLAVLWRGLPPPPPGHDRAPVVVFSDKPRLPGH